MTYVKRIWNHPQVGPAVKLIVAFVVVVQVVLQLWLGKVPLTDLGRGDRAIPLEITTLGVIYGTLYALLGMGIILVYRANHIINFAQAQLGAVPALVALLLVVKRGLPWVIALPIALVGSLLLGGTVEVTVMRRFAKSPRLIATVATMGVAFLLLVLEYQAKVWVGGSFVDIATLTVPTPFSRFTFDIGVLTFRGDHVAPVVVVTVLLAAVGAFFKFTDLGIAVRASAQNRDRALLLGVPAKRVSTIVWMLAAMLSAIGVFFTVPLTGIPLEGFVGVRLLFIGIAVAAVGRMESLRLAFVAGLLIGIVDQSVVFSTNSTRLSSAAIFVAIVVALVFQRRQISRAEDAALTSWGGVTEPRAVPFELRALTEVRVAKVGVAVAVAAFAVTLPFWLGDAYVSSATIGVIYAIIGVSLVVLTGWAGQVSLGQFAIAGVSAGVAAGLAGGHNTDFFLTVAVAAVVGALVAIVIGLPALRVQGLFLAVVTLGFAFVVDSLYNREYFGWLLPGSGELVNRPVLWETLDLGESSSLGGVTFLADTKFYYVCVGFLLVAVAMARALRRYRSGRVLIGVRDNGRQAQAFGINLARSRMAAFGLSGLIAGMAGGLLAYQTPAFSGDAFSPEQSIEIFAMVVIGGVSSVSGAVLGSAFIVGVPLIPGLRDVDQIELLTSGVGLLAVLLLLPGGIAQGVTRLRDAFLTRVARRRAIAVGGGPPVGQQVAIDRQAPSEPRPDVLLACRGVGVAYDRVQVLFGVDLEVCAGECVALLGTNGAGKTTLLRAISGIVGTTAGSVTFGGHDITGADGVATTTAGIVHVPGGRAVFPTLTVAEHLRLAGWLHRDDDAYVDGAIARVHAMFPVLFEREHQMAGNLSGGEQQMLALGMAFITKPKLLMIDELSLGLAPAIVEQLLAIVDEIRRAGTAILVVEQSLDVALAVAERAYFLDKGEVRFNGPTAELQDRDDIVRSALLGGSVGSVAPKRRADSGPPVEGRIALELSAVSKSFGGIRAVRDTSLRVHDGEIVGLIGPNGAGKTTVLDLISGYVVPDSGRITLGEVDVTSMSPDQRAARFLGRSFQDARLVPSLTVAENIALGFDTHIAVRDHVGSMLALPDIADLEADVAWSANDLIELLSLGAFRNKFVGEISTGTRRIVDLAMCLAHGPRVLLLDEPSAGVAQRETDELGPLLLRIRSEADCAMVVVEHDMSLVTSISDRLIVFQSGRPIVEGTPEEVLANPMVMHSYLGTDGGRPSEAEAVAHA